jgi:salicylate hydroxylase
MFWLSNTKLVYPWLTKLQLLKHTPGGFQRLEMMHLGELGTYVNPELCVTTFGDAANAMPPHLAGSLSTGIVGIATFLKELTKRSETLAPDSSDTDIKRVLVESAEAYEARHKPLAQKFVNLSVDQGTRWSGGVTDENKLREYLYQLWNFAKTMGWS